MKNHPSGGRGFTGRKSHYSINRNLERFEDDEEVKDLNHLDSVMGDQDESGDVFSDGESSGSQYVVEDAVSEIKEAELKEHIMKLTVGYKLAYKDIKDCKQLQEPPFKGVDVSRIRNIIKYERSSMTRKAKQERDFESGGIGKVPPKRKRGFKQANLPENDQSVNKR